VPTLSLNQTIEQGGPLLLVQNHLAPGVHRFSLVVVNDRGSQSEPSVIDVVVRRAVVATPGSVARTPVDLRQDPTDPSPTLNPVVRPSRRR
jgi:hypothetical protein